MVIAGVLAFGGLVLPYIVVPMRRAAGLPTYQWDSNTATNPVRSPFCYCYCCCCCCCSAPTGSSWRSPCRLPAGAAGPPTFRAPRLSPLPLSHPSWAPPRTRAAAQFISEWSEHGRKHSFDDAALLAKWSRADAQAVYRYHDPIAPSTAAFPCVAFFFSLSLSPWPVRLAPPRPSRSPIALPTPSPHRPTALAPLTLQGGAREARDQGQAPLSALLGGPRALLCPR
jgi:hypothetical protein